MSSRLFLKQWGNVLLPHPAIIYIVILLDDGHKNAIQTQIKVRVTHPPLRNWTCAHSGRCLAPQFSCSVILSELWGEEPRHFELLHNPKRRNVNVIVASNIHYMAKIEHPKEFRQSYLLFSSAFLQISKWSDTHIYLHSLSATFITISTCHLNRFNWYPLENI